MALFHWLLAATAVTLASARLSGLYVDNGLDQTVVQRGMTASERRDVEEEILHLLGLPERPRAGVSGHAALASSAPQFLLDVYKSLLEPQGQGGRAARSEFNINQRDREAIDVSDAIMSFASHTDHEGGVRHEKGRRLWFDVSEVPVGEMLVGAELRLYQVADVEKDESYTVNVYRLVAEANGEKELEMVDSVTTPSSNEGWILLNVSLPLSAWLGDPASNLGLYLSVHESDHPARELHSEAAGLVGSRGSVERRPFMVGFFKAGAAGRAQPLPRSRITREAKPERRRKAVTSYARNPFTDPGTHWSSRSCQIQTLYVSFRDLDWQDWIIAPDGYGAFYCSGECNFPLNAHMNATNHAIVQTLVHLMNPKEVPKPCCAPTKLTPISVLYFLDDTNVILKKYKNMVVKSCGCH